MILAIIIAIPIALTLLVLAFFSVGARYDEIERLNKEDE